MSQHESPAIDGLIGQAQDEAIYLRNQAVACDGIVQYLRNLPETDELAVKLDGLENLNYADNGPIFDPTVELAEHGPSQIDTAHSPPAWLQNYVERYRAALRAAGVAEA